MNREQRIRQQFLTIKKLIEENIATIRSLLNSADELSKISNQIEDEEVRQSINDTKNSIEKSIDKLINDLHQLFKQYRKVIDELKAA